MRLHIEIYVVLGASGRRERCCTGSFYKSTGHLIECTEQNRNNLPKTVKIT
jgi:hypothetical protein